MVKHYAFLFPGQGTQYPGMAKDLYESSAAARRVLDTASLVLDMDVKILLWESNAETLSRTDRSQCAITCASLAAAAVLREKGIEASVCAGFSLGEWPALCCAGVLSLEDTLRLVKRRGEIMQDVCDDIGAAVPEGEDKPGMAAVMGLDPDTVRSLIGSSGISALYPVNFNSPVQTVVSGTGAALASASILFKDAGARRVVRLMVAGPFHSPLMEKAAELFAKEVSAVEFRDPSAALFSNVTGKRIASGAEAKKHAAQHITHPVLWTAEETAIASLMEETGGEWQLLETGPGKVLSGLWQSSGNAGTCIIAGTSEAIAAVPGIN